MPTRLKSRMIATFDGRKVLQRAEVERDDDADEELQDQQELALLHEVGLARLVDQLRDLEHRLMHRQVLELAVDDRPKSRPSAADHEPESSSVWPSMPPRNVTLDRSGRTRLASPPAAPAPPGRHALLRAKRQHRRRSSPAITQRSSPAPLHTESMTAPLASSDSARRCPATLVTTRARMSRQPHAAGQEHAQAFLDLKSGKRRAAGSQTTMSPRYR